MPQNPGWEPLAFNIGFAPTTIRDLFLSLTLKKDQENYVEILKIQNVLRITRELSTVHKTIQLFQILCWDKKWKLKRSFICSFIFYFLTIQYFLLLFIDYLYCFHINQTWILQSKSWIWIVHNTHIYLLLFIITIKDLSHKFQSLVKPLIYIQYVS